MLSLIIRAKTMADSALSVDAMTMVLRSEGYPDSDIGRTYDWLVHTGLYDVVIERSIPRFVPKESHDEGQLENINTGNSARDCS